MKDEINYHKFSNFLQEEIKPSGNTAIMHSLAIGTLVNWDALSYYGHLSSNIRIQELSEHSGLSLEQAFQVVKYLTMSGVLKREVIKKGDDVVFYYCINERFYDIKNKYVSTYELDWDGVLSWDIYYKTYKQNRVLFHQIDSFLKLTISENNISGDSEKKLNIIKNEYILKIAREMSYDVRVSLKTEAIMEIKKQL